MLLRKMFRDMKVNTSQFISIFLMAILGVLVYSGLNSAWYAMQTAVDKYYKETNLADLWVMGEGFTSDDLLKIKAVNGVKDASMRLTFDGVLSMENQPELRLNIVMEDNISRPKTIIGQKFDLEKDGIWLDEAFANANALKIGDSIEGSFNGIIISKRILGIIIHPEYVHNTKDETIITPDPKSFGYAYLPAAAVSNIKVMNPLPANQLLIKLKDTGKEERVKEVLEEMFSNRYALIIDHKVHNSVSLFNNEIDQTKAISAIFPVVFFVIAALTLLTTMTRLTIGQRTQIAILKAVGFSKNKILFHYLSYGLWIGLIGGIIGLFTGPLVIPQILFKMQKTLYTIPEWPIMIAPLSFVALILAVLCCGASSYFACRKQLKEVPVLGLRPLAPKSKNHSNFEKSKLWHMMGFSTQWNIRDLLRSKVRTTMAIIGVMGSMALILFGLGLKDTIEYLNHWQNEELSAYQSRIDLEEGLSSENKDTIYNRFGGQWLQESGIELRLGTNKKSGVLTVLGKGDMVLFEDVEGNQIKLPETGIMLSYKIAKALKASIGDTIQWRIYGEKNWKNSKINMLHRSPTGQGIVITQHAFNKMGNSMNPTSLLSSKKVLESDAIDGVKMIKTKEQLKDGLNQVLESMMAVVFILIFVSVILGSVVLYNLGILSFTERAREFATLKVLGFFPKKIKGLMIRQNIWTTLIGIILGIPAGYSLLRFMMSTMPDSMDMREYISAKSWFVSILGIFVLSVAVSILLARKIKGFDMVSSLKSVE